MVKSFAAFIMTYNRPVEVVDTIHSLLLQTLPPEKILVVDNSSDYSTKLAIESLDNSRIAYHHVGYNSGPAGAAKVGLRNLTAEGYKWVYWGDDNNPPRTTDAFERIFSLASKINDSKTGALGLMGNTFSLSKATIKIHNLTDMRGVMPVNSLAGGSTMVINTQVYQNSNLLPDEDLFFGYEELDFCLRIKKEGYEIFIDGDYYREQKIISKKERKTRLEKVSVNSRRDSLWREYYSIRNLLVIVYSKHKSWTGLFLILLRVGGKILFSYSKGFSFGRKYSKLAAKAVWDFVNKKMGSVIKPGSV